MPLRPTLAALLFLAAPAVAVGQAVLTNVAGHEAASHHAKLAPAARYPLERYAGRDARGVPHYLEGRFSTDERLVLREQFGIEDPGLLYLADSTTRAWLNYDTERDPGAERLVRTYRVGAPSFRLRGESWEALERRLRTLRPADFPLARPPG